MCSFLFFLASIYIANRLIPRIITVSYTHLDVYKRQEFPRYYFDSPELNDLLASDEWSWTEEEQPEGSAEFIQVAAAQNLLNVTRAGIQTMSLTDNEALKVKSMYPYWNEFIGKSLTTGMKVQYNDGLYRVRQNIATVLENQPPSIDTAALYEDCLLYTS